ncbi:MAG: hypothetical protein MJ234_05475 [bacterium]|nr:hypothetical protein [bacterium]
MDKTIIERKIDDLGALISKNPDNLEALIAYAEYQMRYGSRLEALQAYQHAISVDSGSFEAYAGLAVIYMRQGLSKDGYESLIDILIQDPENVPARLFYKYFSSEHAPEAEIEEAFASLPDYEITLKDIRVMKAHYDSLMALSELAISGYEDLMVENSDDFLCEFKREVASKRKDEMNRFFLFLSGIEGRMMDELLAEKHRLEEEERIRLEEEERIRREEEERIRREEEARRAEEARKAEEERIRREEEERIRREEEERIRREEEARRAEEERLRLEEEERLRLEEEARLAEEERLRLEEEIRIAEEEIRRAEEEARLAEEARKAEEERLMREEKYNAIREQAEELLKSLSKNRGVKKVILLEKGGFEVASVMSEGFEDLGYSEFVSEVVSLIDSHCVEDTPPLLYSVLEYKAGLIVIRMLDSNYMFAVISGSGANFGVLRYAMEKVKEGLSSLLS